MKISTCKTCGASSDTADFYRGVTSRCKECHKSMVRENRAAKADYYRAYDAKRFAEDPRVKDRHARYRVTEAGIASIRNAQSRWLQQNPDKRAAHIILNNAVRDGRVVKPNSCADCGAAGRIHGHHDDYALPLDVVWLCQKCHWTRHRGAA